MSSRPTSSRRLLVSSPPPSKALLSLQNQGLELPASPSSLSLLSAQHASARSTPSDMDKPLPLEPFDRQRRSSSVYSTDTTITNIIRMYGGYRDVDELPDLPSMPLIHQPQAYRDTVAPLLVKRLSLNRSPSPRPPTPPRPRPKASISSFSLRSNAKKTAPSFIEFSRNLEDRRNELVSPFTPNTDHHRQAAYDQLFPPSTQNSSPELPISVSHTPPLPDAMSVTVSSIAESDLLPSPPNLRSTSPPSPIFDTPGQFSALPGRDDSPLSSSSRQRYRSRHWSENWLEDELGVVSPVSGSSPVKDGKNSADYGRVCSASSSGSADHPDVNPESFGKKKSLRSSGRSSLQQGVNGLLRSLSISSRRTRDRTSEPRQRQLAIQPTPYQRYGDQIWKNKKAKKMTQHDEVGHNRGKSMDLVTAYQSGQSQFVSVLEGAKRKLRRKSSHKRRGKLKQSIILVGPNQAVGNMSDKYGSERFIVPEDDRRYI
ncbi:hypothetical protein LTR84_002549 [Exophiala bonariae]|uniref:Uncharacterized protein n=1 Tax=Exophiala bonariae TaxID=1690606 RepID=A0AAV9NB47_9EURO|nr:hypothetical protein LTR84_002549 [Exophiala bonariae]